MSETKFMRGPLVTQGIVRKIELGNFIAIGVPDGPATAYVADVGDALLYRLAPELLEALSELWAWANSDGDPLSDEIEAKVEAVLKMAGGKS